MSVSSVGSSSAASASAASAAATAASLAAIAAQQAAADAQGTGADADAEASNAQTPAVTVTTGAASAAAPAPATYAPTQYSAEVAQDVATVASGSGASIDDQLSAYVDLTDLLFNGALLYKAGNTQDLQAAQNAYDNSDIAKRVQQVGDTYQAQALSQVSSALSSGTQPQGNQITLNVLNGMSSDDQKALFVALQANANFNSAADWISQMEQGAPGLLSSSLAQVAQRFGLAGPKASSAPPAPAPPSVSISASVTATQEVETTTEVDVTASAGSGSTAGAGQTSAVQDPKAVETAKALNTLQQVAESQREWIAALKAAYEGKPAPKAPAASGAAKTSGSNTGGGSSSDADSVQVTVTQQTTVQTSLAVSAQVDISA